MIYALGPVLDTDGVFVSPDGEVYRRLPQSNNRAGYRTVTVARRMCGATSSRHRHGSVRVLLVPSCDT